MPKTIKSNAATRERARLHARIEKTLAEDAAHEAERAELAKLRADVARLRAALEAMLGWSHCIATVEPDELDRDITAARAALESTP